MSHSEDAAAVAAIFEMENTHVVDRVLALATQANGGGRIEPLAAFMTNPARAAIVNAVGPIRQVVQSDVKPERRYLVIEPNAGGKLGQPVQVN
jgi:hypothetical protein